MNLPKMISELRAEKSRLDDAIIALERLSVSQPKRRGRPPQWVQDRSRARLAESRGTEEESPATALN